MSQILEGKNIALRKAKITDAKALFENYWCDKQVAKTMWWKTEESLDSAVARMERTINYQKEHDGFLVVLKETDEPIGMAGIFLRDDGYYEESGIGLARAHQGKGYGKEIVLLLLQLAFIEKGASKFYYCACDHNERSIALAKHFGFRFIRSYKDTRFDGETFMINQYELNREEYFRLVGEKDD